MTDSARIALIVGATGGFGGELALTLLARGWRVRGLTRHAETATAARNPELAAVEWVHGDALREADVVAAAVPPAGPRADLVVHAANPPGYRNWQSTALPMLESSIAAARAAGARLIFPGTVYNFGPETFPLVAEGARQAPRTRKGRIRVAMEARLQAAANAGLKVLIVRAGDFVGGRGGGNNWFSQAMVRRGRPLERVAYPGRPDAGHTWAYLPDLAETVMRLLDRETELADFEVFHFGGHWFEPGVGIARAACRVAGIPESRVGRFPWLAIYALSPLVVLFREMLEMRYLWQQPLRLDNAKLVAFLGEEPHTPTEAMLRETLEQLECLPDPVSRCAVP